MATLDIPARRGRANTQGYKAAALLRHSIRRHGGELTASDGLDVLVNAGVPLPVNRGTATRIRKAAGVQTRRVGFGPGSHVVWYLTEDGVQS